jgi:hypothetical protein
MSETAAPRERTKTIELPEAISDAKGSWSHLELRVPKIGEVKRAQTHLRGTADSMTQMMIVLVSIVTGIPEPLIAKIDYDIVMEASDFLMGFMPTPPKTSET